MVFSRTCRLLGCPLEIRQRIYSFVLAPGMIHIEWEPEDGIFPWESQADTTEDNPLRNRVCNVPETETEFYHRWICRQKEGHTDYEDSAAERHAGKSGSWRTSHDLERHALDLRLLRVCRQIYSECHMIVYTDNVFAFEELVTFHKFIASIKLEQRQCIRTLAFGLTIKKYAQGSTLDGITAEQTENLDKLRTVNICLHLDLWYADESERVKRDGILTFLMAAGFDKLTYHGRRSLEEATVVVTESARLEEGEPINSDRPSGIPASALAELLPDSFEWTSDERRTQAQAAREKLMTNGRVFIFTEAEIQARETLRAAMLRRRELMAELYINDY